MKKRRLLLPFLLVLFILFISGCDKSNNQNNSNGTNNNNGIQDENYEVTEEEFNKALDFTDDNNFRFIIIQNHYVYGEEIALFWERYNNVRRQPNFWDNNKKNVDYYLDKNNDIEYHYDTIDGKTLLNPLVFDFAKINLYQYLSYDKENKYYYVDNLDGALLAIEESPSAAKLFYSFKFEFLNKKINKFSAEMHDKDTNEWVCTTTGTIEYDCVEPFEIPE